MKWREKTLNIFIKEESSLPIYEQIVSAVKNSILNHELAPGDMLPSIRSLAKSLGISVITTKRAYEELEKQGLIYSEQGKGFFVSRFNPNILLEEQLKTLEDHLADVVLEAKTLNLSVEELTDMVRLLWDKEVDHQ
jgi:GntR family transcriptional regulator